MKRTTRIYILQEIICHYKQTISDYFFIIVLLKIIFNKTLVFLVHLDVWDKHLNICNASRFSSQNSISIGKFHKNYNQLLTIFPRINTRVLNMPFYSFKKYKLYFLQQFQVHSKIEQNFHRASMFPLAPHVQNTNSPISTSHTTLCFMFPILLKLKKNHVSQGKQKFV